jgi:hypothetical protein
MILLPKAFAHKIMKNLLFLSACSLKPKTYYLPYHQNLSCPTYWVPHSMITITPAKQLLLKTNSKIKWLNDRTMGICNFFCSVQSSAKGNVTSGPCTVDKKENWRIITKRIKSLPPYQIRGRSLLLLHKPYCPWARWANYQRSFSIIGGWHYCCSYIWMFDDVTHVVDTCWSSSFLLSSDSLRLDFYHP